MDVIQDQTLGPAGLRVVPLRAVAGGQRRTGFALAGAIALHVGVVMLLILLGRQALRLPEEAAPTFTMVFAPQTASAVAPPNPAVQPDAPAPQEPAPPPQPTTPPEPQAESTPPPPTVNPIPPLPLVPEPQAEAAPLPPVANPVPAPPLAPEPLTAKPVAPALPPKPVPVRRPSHPMPTRHSPRAATSAAKPETRTALLPPMPSAEPSAAAIPTPSPQVATADAIAGWRSALAAWLQSHKTYPEVARRNGDQGRVTVRFTVDRDGRVLDVALVQSSGSQILDEAAETLLRGARLPPFPPGMAQNQVTITLPIRYALEH